MSERLTVLVGVQEAGSANALIPVIKELQGRGGIDVALVACAEAVSVLKQAGLAPDELRGNVEAAQQLLDEMTPDLLLLGTAWGPSLDKILLRLANAQGLPTLSVVDHWSCYRERFTEPSSGTCHWPTMIAVPDAFAMTEAIEAGVPADRLVVTGQPHLDALARAVQGTSLQHDASRLRGEWLTDGLHASSRRLIVFVSEALSYDHPPGTGSYRGYTEVEALDGLLQAVHRVEQDTGLAVKIVAKLHPKERRYPSALKALAARWDVRLVNQEAPWPCILAADAVVGMSSMLLIEAALAGQPTMSFQPGALPQPPFVGIRLGLVASARSVEALAQWIRLSLEGEGSARREQLLSPLAASCASLVRGDAAVRIAQLVVGLGVAA